MAEQEHTRQRILETAGPLFAEKGFEATSIRDITARLHSSSAVVNYHFRSKEQLYVEAVRYAYESIARRAPLPQWPEGTPAEVRLRDFVHALLRRVLTPQADPWHIQLLMREVAQPTAGACAEFVRDFVRPMFTVLMGILRELAPADFPAPRLHLLAASIVGQCLHYHHARHVLPLLVGEEQARGYDLETLTGHVYEFSLAGLRGVFEGHSEGVSA
jgi:TetR/AcrR family transcriptional regulator, regulator of cefoperazone and chloramphenicol sensitivity